MNGYRIDRDPMENMMRMQDDALRTFNSRHAHEHVSSRVWAPAVDVYEDGDVIVIKADLPGMRQEDIDSELTGEQLTIRGERRFDDENKRERYVRVERQYGNFQRSFTIGIPIENAGVRASYRNGILEITVPKAEATKPKKVQVSAE